MRGGGEVVFLKNWKNFDNFYNFENFSNFVKRVEMGGEVKAGVGEGAGSYFFVNF